MAPGKERGGREKGGAGSAKPGMGDPDYGAIYAAASESNSRLRYWIYSIYDLHGLPIPALYKAPHAPALHDYEPEPLRLLLLTRCLILELWTFQTIHGHYMRIKGGLTVERTGGLDMIIKGHRVHGRLKSLRDDIAHSGTTLGEFACKINSLGLDSYVYYARAALMFEDAAYQKIPHAHHRREGREMIPIENPFMVPGFTERDTFAKKYSEIDFDPNAERRKRECTIMRELNHSLRMLYRGFCKAERERESNPPHGRFRFNDHLYNVKYMILDIYCFIEKFRKLGLHDIVTPGFISREGIYEELRHDYSAHTKIKKIRSVEDMLGTRPSLLGDMLLDIVEIDALASRLLERFEAPPTGEIRPISVEQSEKMNQKLWSMQVESHRFYGYEHVESYRGLTGSEARERARQDLGSG